MKKIYSLQSEVTLYPGISAWYFAHVDRATSAGIKESQSNVKRGGFGSIKVMVQLGKTSWQTSIFPDRASGTFLLPLKASIRKKENIREGNYVDFSIQLI